MLSTQMGLMQAYKVLGVSGSSTLPEIRSAYRALMRESHPDINGEDPEMLEKVQQIAEAYEVVLELHREPEKVSEPETTTVVQTEIQVGDFWCKLISLKREGAWGTESVLKLPLAYCEINRNTLQHFTLIGEDGQRFWSLNIDVIDDRKDILFSTSAYTLKQEYERYRRACRAETMRSLLVVLQNRLDNLPVSKKPAGHPVFGHFVEYKTQLRWYVDGWRPDGHLRKAQDLLRQIEREISGLEQSDPVGIAIEQLMSGKSRSTSHTTNLETVARINAAAVRTGGFIETYGEEQMQEFYRGALEGFDNPLAHLFDKSLLLDLEDHAPSDLVDDPDLEAAPTHVEFSSNKGQTSFEVTYRYINEQPTAIVRLPLKVYERHAPEYGRPSRFPVLPHGIVWAVEVTFDGKLVARGPVDHALNSRIEKWKRGKNRSKHAEESFTMGDSIYGAERSEVPPWYQGKSKPGRRK